MLRTSILLAFLGLGLASDATAKCARVVMAPYVITPKNTPVAGGGVLVGIGYGKDTGNASDPQPVEQPGWRFRHGATLAKPTINTLAPGLAVYQVAGDGSLLDDKQRVLVTVRRGKAAAALSAPKIVTANGKIENNRRFTQTILKVELASPPPAGATGAILYRGTTAVHWTTSLSTNMSELSFYAGGHCGTDIPGTSVPTSGDIQIAWFDAAGRLSPRSNALGVKSPPRVSRP